MLAVKELIESLMWWNADPENFCVQCELMKRWLCWTWNLPDGLHASTWTAAEFRDIFLLSGHIPSSAALGTAKLYVRQLFNWFFSSCNNFILCKNKNLSGAQNRLWGCVFYSPINYFWEESLFFKLIFTLRAESRIRLNASFVHQTEEKKGSVRSEDLKKTQKSAAGLLPWLRCSGEWWFNVLMDRKEVDKRGDSHDFTSNLPELSLTLQRKRNKIPYFFGFMYSSISAGRGFVEAGLPYWRLGCVLQIIRQTDRFRPGLTDLHHKSGAEQIISKRRRCSCSRRAALGDALVFISVINKLPDPWLLRLLNQSNQEQRTKWQKSLGR